MLNRIAGIVGWIGTALVAVAVGIRLFRPERPLVAVVGGAKVSTKIDLLENLVDQGRRPRHRRRHGQHVPRTRSGIEIGKSLAEKDLAATARRIMPRRAETGCAIILPVDAVVAHAFKAGADNHDRTASTRSPPTA